MDKFNVVEDGRTPDMEKNAEDTLFAEAVGVFDKDAAVKRAIDADKQPAVDGLAGK